MRGPPSSAGDGGRSGWNWPLDRNLCWVRERGDVDIEEVVDIEGRRVVRSVLCAVESMRREGIEGLDRRRAMSATRAVEGIDRYIVAVRCDQSKSHFRESIRVEAIVVESDVA